MHVTGNMCGCRVYLLHASTNIIILFNLVALVLFQMDATIALRFR